MKIQKFLSLMLPTFERSRLTEELTVLRSEINEITLPPYLSVKEHYSRTKLHAKQCQNYDREFGRKVSPKLANQNYLWGVTTVLEGLDERLDTIEKMVHKAFAQDVGSTAISFTRANLIQYVEVVSFASRYARRLLLWTLSEEQSEGDSAYKIPKAMSKAEERWVWDNREYFIQACRILYIAPRQLESSFAAIPDMTVAPDEVAMIEQTLGATKTDPLGFGLIPVRLNPIYYVRMAVAEWQVTRYKAALEEKRALEYRLLALWEETAPDARLQQEIAYTEGRLQKLNKKVTDMESDYYD
jgi:hypothetical protein